MSKKRSIHYDSGGNSLYTKTIASLCQYASSEIWATCVGMDSKSAKLIRAEHPIRFGQYLLAKRCHMAKSRFKG